MHGLDLREVECFLVLAEELHFGRTGERLYVSQSRVSQLLRSLERRVGARLVERTSRRVRLTPLGERLADGLRPAHEALAAAVEDARAAARGVEGTLRIGFQGAANEDVAAAVDTFQRRHPGCVAELAEVPLRDPFGPVHRGEVDAAVVLLPVREPGLVTAAVFSRERQVLAVAARHPFARRASVGAEELAGCALIGAEEPAPAYWRLAQAPDRTPSGRPVPAGPRVGTLQEGIALAAAGRGAMLLCRATAGYHVRRDVAFVPVEGLPLSALGLVWPEAAETERLRAFARALTDACTAPRPDRGSAERAGCRCTATDSPR